MAFQKYIDNAVSKTINLPANARPEEVEAEFMTAWQSGCKGITVYRYGSRSGQLLQVGKEVCYSAALTNSNPSFDESQFLPFFFNLSCSHSVNL